MKSAFSRNKQSKEAVAELKKTFGEDREGLILYFVSSTYHQEEIAHEMKQAFESCEVIGCSTAGELGCGQMMEQSIVAMNISSGVANKVKVNVIENLNQRNRDSVKSALPETIKTFDYKDHVGIVLFEANAMSEEWLMDELGNVTNVPFVGGTAGDDCTFTQTYVHANGRVFTNAAILALLHVPSGYSILKTQSFSRKQIVLKATKVNEKTRTVHEFNHKPATTAYAEALGIKENELDQYFSTNPVGLMIGEDPFVRSPQRICGTSIVFYCNILEGMNVEILESGDIVAETKRVVDQHKQNKPVKGLIDFQCILRALPLRATNQTDAYGRIYEGIEMIGFSTYGEAYLGNINQTSTMLTFH